MLLRKRDQLRIELVRRADADRVEGIGDDHEFCLYQCLLRNTVQIRQIAVLLLDCIVVHIRMRHNPAHLEHRVTRIRHKDHISGITEYHADMSHRLL